MSLIDQLKQLSAKNEKIRHEGMKAIIPDLIDHISGALVAHATTSSVKEFDINIQTCFSQYPCTKPVGEKWRTLLNSVLPKEPTKEEWKTLREHVMDHFGQDMTVRCEGYQLYFSW